MNTNTILSAAALLALAVATAATAGTPPPKRGTSGFAVVDDTGTLVRGRNATGAIHLDLGIYEVDFTTSIKNCAFTATTGLPGSDGSNVAGFVTLAGRGGNAEGVYVRTFDSKGDSADLGFHLNVRC